MLKDFSRFPLNRDLQVCVQPAALNWEGFPGPENIRSILCENGL